MQGSPSQRRIGMLPLPIWLLKDRMNSTTKPSVRWSVAPSRPILLSRARNKESKGSYRRKCGATFDMVVSLRQVRGTIFAQQLRDTWQTLSLGRWRHTIMANDTEHWDAIKANLVDFRRNVKQQWPMLTDDEIFELHGSRELLAAKIQERYAVKKDAANRQIDEWIHKFYEAVR